MNFVRENGLKAPTDIAQSIVLRVLAKTGRTGLKQDWIQKEDVMQIARDVVTEWEEKHGTEA